MDCSLWLNRRKVNSAAEIAEHFDIAALRGYFLGGSLSEWLREHGGRELADKLDALDPADPLLNQRIAEIFGQEAAQKPVFVGSVFTSVCCSGSFTAGSSSAGSFGGFGSYSLGSGAFSFGSGVSAGSYLFGSGSSYFSGSFSSFTKLRLWEWEWEWRFGGSFRGGSYGFYGFGSYVFGSGAYLLGSGAYLSGSGSYLPGSFAAGFGLYSAGSFNLGSFGLSGSFREGSFSTGAGLTPEEYDRIMYETLRRCPLNCFGYGVHII